MSTMIQSEYNIRISASYTQQSNAADIPRPIWDPKKVYNYLEDMGEGFKEYKRKAVNYYRSEFAKNGTDGPITVDELKDEIKKYMISFEIERNGIAQAVMSSRNNENKSAEKIAGANFILSTIHSAKGLEFDNVVIYYDSESESKIDEATKRMYYVALTRAKKTEFVFAYDTMAKPKIGNDYDRIIKDLTTIAASGNASADDDSDNNDDD